MGFKQMDRGISFADLALKDSMDKNQWQTRLLGIAFSTDWDDIKNLLMSHHTIVDALEWLAAMCSHVPNKGEQMVRYYGHYSNVCRGKRKKQNQDGLIPCILEPDENSRAYRKNWARFIKKIYEVGPLTCPKCQGRMRIMRFITFFNTPSACGGVTA